MVVVYPIPSEPCPEPMNSLQCVPFVPYLVCCRVLQPLYSSTTYLPSCQPVWHSPVNIQHHHQWQQRSGPVVTITTITPLLPMAMTLTSKTLGRLLLLKPLWLLLWQLMSTACTCLWLSC